ncbi:MAG TPA: tetratricopeptide repeat-containing glycosyltransferase family protein [Patescibacteria group bacterium]|nr:tetratricopeptide repeat-containing glycosyltransferase family protein [Patescibacteria group bacterium]
MPATNAVTVLTGQIQEKFQQACLILSDGHPEEALAEFRRLLPLAPHFPGLHFYIGYSLNTLGHCQEAIESYQRALQLDPQSSQAAANISHALVAQGKWSAGWQYYDQLLSRNFPSLFGPLTAWNGECFSGKRLLVFNEGGLGDTLQNIRFLPQIKQRGGHITLLAQPSLCPLLAGASGFDKLLAGDSPKHLPVLRPHYDFHVRLGRLPLLLGITPLSPMAPYLTPPVKLEQHWRQIVNLEAGTSAARIGLVWHGSAKNKNRALDRTCPLAALAPLFHLPQFFFVSLQIGAGHEELTPLSTPRQPRDFAPELTNFAHTAALIAQLDLVITIDTATAHLAGALGKPTWVLLPFFPESRWQFQRSDTPWYSSLRLFRQPRPGDWPAVVQQIMQELNSWHQSNLLRQKAAIL